MIGSRYTFLFSTDHGLPVIDGIYCLSDLHARQLATWRADVLQVRDGRRIVWSRGEVEHAPLHDEGEDCA